MKLSAIAVRRTGTIRAGSFVLILASLLVLAGSVPIGRLVRRLAGEMDSLGALGPLVYGLLYVVGSLLLVPGAALTLGAGFVFGFDRVAREDGAKVLHLSGDDDARRVEVDEILLGVGRRPHVEGLGLEAAGVAFGFVPNPIATMVESPPVAEAYLSLARLFGSTELTPVERQVVLLAASVEKSCTYCVAAHSVVAELSGMDASTLAALRNGRPIDDTPLQSLRRFATEVVHARGFVADPDIEEVLAAGFTRRNVLEVVLGVTMKTLSNYVNHFAGTPLDPPFEQHCWSPFARNR